MSEKTENTSVKTVRKLKFKFKRVAADKKFKIILKKLLTYISVRYII